MEDKERTKVLFLIGSFGTGGKERQMAELIHGLDQKKYELHLLIKSDGAHYFDIMKDNLCSVHNLNREHFGIRAIADIIRLMRMIRPDIVHSWAETTSLIAVINKFLLPRRFELIDGSIRMAPKLTKYLSFYYFQRKIINAFSDKIVANSEAGLKSFHVSGRKSQVIYNGFNLNRIANLREPWQVKEELGIKTDFVAGMVARIDDAKDWPTFFAAAEKLLESRKDITYIIVGNGPYLSRYKKRIKPEFRDFFVFTGERNDVESIANIFDIGILTSYSEGISNSIMEYMALGKPVIASGAGGIPELVIHEKTGYIHKVGDKRALTQFTNKLLDEKQLRDQMGVAAQKRISETFGYEVMINAYNQLYTKILCAG